MKHETRTIHRRGGGAGANPSAPAPALAALITLDGPRFELTFVRLAASVKAAAAEVELARRSPAADAADADDAGGGAESGIRCPSGPPLALAAEPLSALPPPLALLDGLRPYICDGGGTGYGVRRDEAEKAEAGAADKGAVLVLAARARADAALISLDALVTADEVEDAF